MFGFVAADAFDVVDEDEDDDDDNVSDVIVVAAGLNLLLVRVVLP